jgi:hypothetical protein
MLTLLHTSPVHVPTFSALFNELAPEILVQHQIDERLLQEACNAGEITPHLRQRIGAILEVAFQAESRLVLCTCSTIGGCAEQLGAQLARPVLRVDRAMAERAVALGERIVVLAALKSTLAPTRQLLHEAAARAAKVIEMTAVLCPGAWAKFEVGDLPGYHTLVAEQIRRSARQTDVIVLAQASMAGAAARCPDVAIPILSSPRLGVEAAIALYRSQTG